jgi:putative ABC transport system substrate-binding protein
MTYRRIDDMVAVNWFGAVFCPRRQMRRRELLTFIGAVAAWPLAARAQQSTGPLIGFLGSESADAWANRLSEFRRGLNDLGYVEGQNLTVVYRWAGGHNDRLPSMAADLAGQQVKAIIAPGSTPAALAAHAATKAIPVIFEIAADPVEIGLVASLNQPGSNVTGVTTLNSEISTKRLELLHSLVPATTVLGLLVNPTNSITQAGIEGLQAAGHQMGLELRVLNASSADEFEARFAELNQSKAAGLLILADPLFSSHAGQLAELSLRYAMPAIYQFREFVVAGGLLSYGTSFSATFRTVGNYTGRILNGEKPADLPVQQATLVELIINLKTAKTLGITVPLSLLGRADEAIE